MESTTGFSKQMWLFGTNGDHQCERTMFLKAKLTNDYNHKEEIDVIKHAQLIWRKNWDDTRKKGPNSRIDVGKAVGSRKQNTDKSWLANRHAIITKAMRSASQRSHHALPAADIVAWEASPQEAKAYQESKRAGLLVEAFEAGALLDEEKLSRFMDLLLKPRRG